MAQRRMFSKVITNSEEFYEMPATSQLLYFHLSMNADDDGFIQPTRVMRMTGIGNKDDLKILHVKGFVIPIADKVIVIRHWHINNTIRKDRYTMSIYQEHLKYLGLDEKTNKYVELNDIESGKPNDNQRFTQVENPMGKPSILDYSKLKCIKGERANPSYKNKLSSKKLLCISCEKHTFHNNNKGVYTCRKCGREHNQISPMATDN